MFKYIQNRFYFSKIKNFMFQRLISEHRKTPVSKCAIPEKIQTRGEEGWGREGEGGLRTYFFEKDPGIFGFVS